MCFVHNDEVQIPSLFRISLCVSFEYLESHLENNSIETERTIVEGSHEEFLREILNNVMEQWSEVVRKNGKGQG